GLPDIIDGFGIARGRLFATGTPGPEGDDIVPAGEQGDGVGIAAAYSPAVKGEKEGERRDVHECDETQKQLHMKTSVRRSEGRRARTGIPDAAARVHPGGARCKKFVQGWRQGREAPPAARRFRR